MRRRLLVERLGDRRVLAAITGTVFEDANHSFQQDPDEANAASRLIYVDSNDNAVLDPGELFVVAEPDGSFEFDNVPDGTYLLRLFNGTDSQSQTYPVEATIDGDTISVTGQSQLELLNGHSLTLTADSIIRSDTTDGTSETVPVGNQLIKMQTLPDGTVLVIGTEAGADTAWIVDPQTATVMPTDLSGLGESTPWSDVAIDGEGRGVLLEHSGTGIVRSIDASGNSLQVTTTSNLVPDDTQVLTSETGNRTVFAWGGTDGLQMSLWSNVTSSFITSPIDVSGTTSLLAFDDASGLLAARTSDGGISVLSVNDNFGRLHTVDDNSGPVAIDGPRDLLLTISPVDAMLKLINLGNGSLVADLALDLSTVGQVASLALNDEADAVVVVGAAGIVEVALRKAAANEVTVSGGQDVDSVLFGVTLNGDNTAPSYTNAPPSFEVPEDGSIALPAPAALSDSADAEDDTFVLVQRTNADKGDANMLINGALTYIPDADFNGSDSVEVVLHDGRDFDTFTVSFDVTPVPDDPSGITVTIDPVPESMPPGQPIGQIDVIDADGIGGGGHVIDIDDQRFGVRNGQIILISGPLDYETEPVIPLGITVIDNETHGTIHEIVAVSVGNVNEPITAILPHEADVFENAPGAGIAHLIVIDDDIQGHTFTVDDDRFEVVDEELRLKTDVSLDFEKEPSVVVNVTATEVPDGGTFTQPIEIEVLDIDEQPENIELSNDTVTELMPGDEVGQVTVDGGTPSSRFEATVNDSRFEIDGNTLKLLDDQIVERAAQAEIELTITVSDLQNEFNTISQSFVIQVLENETPFHNHDNPYDVDHSGEVTALDALAIINFLNAFGPGPIGQGNPGFCYDVNADSLVTAIDALLVLNELNRINNGGGGTVGGEGEEIADDGGSRGEGEQVAAQDGNNGSLTTTDDDDDELGAIDAGHQDKDLVQTPGLNGDLVAGKPIEIPGDNDREEFAKNIDETLRLLSDEKA